MEPPSAYNQSKNCTRVRFRKSTVSADNPRSRRGDEGKSSSGLAKNVIGNDGGSLDVEDSNGSDVIQTKSGLAVAAELGLERLAVLAFIYALVMVYVN